MQISRSQSKLDYSDSNIEIKQHKASDKRWMFSLLAILGALALFFMGSHIIPLAYSATFVVNTSHDQLDHCDGFNPDGSCNHSTFGCDNISCSLREAIFSSNTNPGKDTIVFSVNGQIQDDGSNITDPVVIDGAGTVSIKPNVSFGGTAFTVEAGDSTIEGLSIQNWTVALDLKSGGGNLVQGNTLIRDTLGVEAENSPNNIIKGNYIGIDASGTKGIGNVDGIELSNSSGNMIGGTSAEARNIISGNNEGIVLDLSTNTVIQGNYIGTDVSGKNALGNKLDGIDIDSSSSNTIGGTTGVTVDGSCTGACNLISGNGAGGIRISAGQGQNKVQGNYVGTDVSGNNAIGNSGALAATFAAGVYILSSPNNIVGGTTPAARNIISGNFHDGTEVIGSQANTIQGNFVGTTADGHSQLGNNRFGIFIDAASQNTIGGTTGVTVDGPCTGACNLISGNGDSGIRILAGQGQNKVQGNYIGTDVSGNNALGNKDDGIDIASSPGNAIGNKSSAEARNIISSNTFDGVDIYGSQTKSNTIEGNYIGTSVDGLSALGNGRFGVFSSYLSGGNPTTDGASQNTIGGTTGVTVDGGGCTGACNLISGNKNSGIVLFNGQGQNKVQGNYVGTDLSGSKALGNLDFGVEIISTSNNVIGGISPETRNIISGNGQHGIVVNTASSNELQGNYIGTDSLGKVGVANLHDGILVLNSNDNTIGFGTSISPNDSDGNVISGNTGQGIELISSDSTAIRGNYIGTDVSGSNPVANGFNGVHISDSATSIVGGTEPTSRNIISGNLGHGIQIDGAGSTSNTIQGNYIGTSASGTEKLPNQASGIMMAFGIDPATDNPSDNVIGGIASNPSNANANSLTGQGETQSGCTGTCNLISGNGDDGITILTGKTGTDNKFQGNYIGTDSSGQNPLGNSQFGILVYNSSKIVIGGTEKAARNILSANKYGLGMEFGANNNTLEGNYIGAAADGLTKLGNTADGVFIQDSSNDKIGGNSTGEANLIAGNEGNGVTVTGNSATDDPIRGNLIYNNTKLSIDLGDNGITPNDDGQTENTSDTDSGPNDLMNAPVAISSSYNDTSNTTEITGRLISEDPESSVIDIYSSAKQPNEADAVATSTDNSNGGAATTNTISNAIATTKSYSQSQGITPAASSVSSLGNPPVNQGTAKPDADGYFSKSLNGRWTSSYFTTFATNNKGSGDTSEAGPSCGIDSSGDGLCDRWKTVGLDINHDGIPDFKPPDAKVGCKDIYVEIDSMQGFEPSDNALNAVHDAFADAPVTNNVAPGTVCTVSSDGKEMKSTGINLHLYKDETIPVTTISFSSFPRILVLPGSFEYLKAKYFGTAIERENPDIVTAKQYMYHYAIFANKIDENSGRLGHSQVFGTDIIIAMGSLFSLDHNMLGRLNLPIVGCCSILFKDAVAGDFMHELGHNLGLEHYGPRSSSQNSLLDPQKFNCKPNYLSVMSYTFTEPYLSHALDRKYNRPLDYSRSALSDLNEGSLDETKGVDKSITGTLHLKAIYGKLSRDLHGMLTYKNYITDTGVPVDWDGRDANPQDTNIEANINNLHDTVCGSESIDNLPGAEDWSALKYNFRDGGQFSPISAYKFPISPEPTVNDTIDMTLHAVTLIPKANSQNATLMKNTPIKINLTGMDPLSNNTLKFSIVTPPHNGVLGKVNPINATSAAVTYTPNTGYVGNDNFTFIVDSGRNDTSGNAIGGLDGTVNLQILNSNVPPIANAGANQTVNDGELVTLDGRKSNDPANSGIVSYQWTQTGGPPVNLNGSNNAIATFTAPFVNTDTTLAFRLTVTNNAGAVGTATTYVLVKNVNIPPVANAGANQTINDNSTSPIILDGTKSHDPDGTIKSYQWTQVSGSPIVQLIGANTSKASFNVPVVTSDTVLTFQLTVTDNDGANSTSATNVLVKHVNVNVNKSPIAVVGPAQTVNENETVTLNGTKSNDPDGTIRSYIWAQTAGPKVNLSSAGTANPTFTAPQVHADTTLTFSLTVTDNQGANSTNAASTNIIVKHINTPPTAVVRPTNQTVNENTANVILDGSASSDKDGTIKSYSWTQTLGPSVSLTNANTSKASFTAPSVVKDTTLTFKLSVTDNDNTTSSATTNILVKNVNIPPVANAGTNQTVNENATGVMLDGSKSFDKDGTITSYSWTQTAGPTVVLTGADAASPTFNAPSVTNDTTLTFKLTVTDNDGAPSSATVSVLVKNVNQSPPPSPPIANAGVNQTVSAGSTVTLDGTKSSAQNGASITSYQWIQTSGPIVTLTGANTATASFVAPTVNANTTITFKLTVTDSNAETSSASTTVSVTVKHTNVPPVANAGSNQTANAGGLVTLDGSKSNDPNGGKITSYQWTQTSGSPVITLNGANTAKPTFTAPSVAKDTTFTFRLVVTDDSGLSSAPSTVSVLVKHTAATPTILTLNTITNVPWGTKIIVTGKLANSDASKTGIGGGATITFSGTGAANLTSTTTKIDGTFTTSGITPMTVGTGLKVQAHFAGDTSHKASDSAVRNYNTLKHTVSLTVSASSSTLLWNTPTHFTATLTDTLSGKPIIGKRISFTGSGVIPSTLSNITDSTGKATVIGTSPSVVRPAWTFQAKFAGDNLYSLQNSALGRYSTIAHSTALTLTVSPTTVPHLGKYSLSGILTDLSTSPPSAPTSKMVIRFTTSLHANIGAATTDSLGKYAINNLAAPKTAGSFSIQASFAGTNLYKGANSQASTLIVTSTTTASAPVHPSSSLTPPHANGTTTITAAKTSSIIPSNKTSGSSTTQLGSPSTQNPLILSSPKISAPTILGKSTANASTLSSSSSSTTGTSSISHTSPLTQTPAPALKANSAIASPANNQNTMNNNNNSPSLSTVAPSLPQTQVHQQQPQLQTPYPYQNHYPYSQPSSPSPYYQSQQPSGIQHVNQPPIANAGVSQTIYGGATVVLDGRTSYDPDNYATGINSYGSRIMTNNGIATYQWTQVQIPTTSTTTPAVQSPVVMLQGANIGIPTFVAPVLPYDTMLAFSLKVIDSDGGAASSNPSIVYVMVKHNPNNIGTTGGNTPDTTILQPQHQQPQQPIVPNNNAPSQPNSPPTSSPPQIGSPHPQNTVPSPGVP